jgi:ribosomal protein L16 Arg81 hydroxylase
MSQRVLALALSRLPEHEFLTRIWTRKPWRDVFDVDEISQRMSLFDLDPSTLFAKHQGRAKAIWTDDRGGYREAFIAGEDLDRAYEAGCSVCLLGYNSYASGLDEFLTSLSSELRVPSDTSSANLYLSPAGSGVKWHFDRRQVFSLHLVGKKKWWYAPGAQFPNPRLNFVPDFELHQVNHPYLNLVSVPADEQSVACKLKRGDLLYLPAGTWHRTEALEASIGLTLGFVPLSPLDLYLKTLEKTLSKDASWRRPMLPNESNSVLAAALQELVENIPNIEVAELLALLPGAGDQKKN